MPEQTPHETPTRGSTRVVRIRLGSSFDQSPRLLVAVLWSITLLLTGFGLIMVLSASAITSYLEDQGFFGGFARQAMFAVIGLALMVFAATRKLKFWKMWAWPLFFAGLALQGLVFTSLGVVVGGNRNWLELGPIRGQPSEVLKLALIVWMGAVLATKERLLKKPIHELIPAIFPGAVIALLLVLLGGDLGTGVVMFAMVLGVLFFGRVSWKTITVTLIGSLGAAVLLVVTSENRMRRFASLFGDQVDYSGSDWQPLHGIWALAGGGLLGTGLGGSKAKWSWLPAADNDYIFAIIGEEFGFVGGVITILMYLALAFALIKTISIARDRFGRAVVGGVLVWIIGQAFINIGVVVRILPVIGVPLPLISSGGTALVSCLIAMGVVISIARDGVRYQQEQLHGASGKGEAA